jgi:hypothetical protein
MSSEDANDVTKALAAFGAPSIRYHSFGQGQVKPSSIVMPRREPMPPAPLQALGPLPAPAPLPPLAFQEPLVTPPLLRQAEPDAAPEPQIVPAPLAPALSPMPPVPAFRRTIDPATVLARPTPMPPPRPLSERPLGSLTPSAAPAPMASFTPAAPNPNAPPPLMPSVSAFHPSGPAPTAPPAYSPVPAPSPSPTASLGPLPTPMPVPRPASDMARAPVDFVPPAVGFSRPSPPLVTPTPDRPPMFEHPVAPATRTAAKTASLKEIFALLAAGPSPSTVSPRG